MKCVIDKNNIIINIVDDNNIWSGEKIYYKVSWYKENCKDEYTRDFGNRDIDIFEEYK